MTSLTSSDPAVVIPPAPCQDPGLPNTQSRAQPKQQALTTGVGVSTVGAYRQRAPICSLPRKEGGNYRGAQVGQAEGAPRGSPAWQPLLQAHPLTYPYTHQRPSWASDTTSLHSPSTLPQSWELGTASSSSSSVAAGDRLG